MQQRLTIIIIITTTTTKLIFIFYYIIELIYLFIFDKQFECHDSSIEY